jgi:hypothetical protein
VHDAPDSLRERLMAGVVIVEVLVGLDPFELLAVEPSLERDEARLQELDGDISHARGESVEVEVMSASSGASNSLGELLVFHFSCSSVLEANA